MKISLSQSEIDLLSRKGVTVDSTYEYTDDEALDLLDNVRDIEVSYAQGTDTVSTDLYKKYGDIADKLSAMI